MAQNVYSTRFIGKAMGPDGDEFTVPEGFIAVVRDIDAWSAGGELVNWRVSIGTDPAFAGGQFTVEAIDQFQPWRGRVVLEPGEDLITTSDGSYGIVIGGYLLTLP